MHPDDCRLFCVLATYHRPDGLAVTLEAIKAQTRPPDVIVIVDNGSDSAVRPVAERFGAQYIDAKENLGPAGAFSLAMEKVLSQAGPGDWVVTIGDDDPPSPADRFEQLWDFGLRMVDLDERVAGVGAMGARYDRHSGKFVRVPDSELRGPVRVDYLGGNQLLHRCESLRHVGTYRSELFFGFEEAEWGFRATRSGWSLYAHGAVWRDDRLRYNRMGTSRPRTPVDTSAWRRYYSVRNATMLAREHAKWRRAAITTGLRGGLGGAAALFVAGRPFAEVLLPMRGAVDGLKGKSGRTIDPSTANKWSQ